MHPVPAAVLEFLGVEDVAPLAHELRPDLGGEERDGVAHFVLAQRGDDDLLRVQFAGRFARDLQTHHPGTAEDEDRAAVRLRG